MRTKLAKGAVSVALTMGSVAAFAAAAGCCGDLACCLQRLMGCCG